MVGTREGSMTAPQRAVTDPTVSAWVGASAGSGKTHVLTGRILRLLLAGVPPHRILCLTYTRAAAAEMANRVGRALAAWTAAKSDDIADSLGRAATREEVERARRLFAQVIDAPDGLRIETLHGFCQSLLGRFPLEAGVGPHFRVIEERTADELLTEARNRAIAASALEPALRGALDIVSSHADDVAFGTLMGSLVRERRRLAAAFEEGGLDGAAAALWRQFDFDAPADAAQIVRAACRAKAFDRKALKSAVAALEQGSDADGARAGGIASWLASTEEDRVAAFDDYAANFLTSAGSIRKTLATQAVAKRDPAAPEALRREAERMLGAVERRKAAVVARASAALLRLAERVLLEYEAAKRRGAALDYDDLILATRRLLGRPGISPWVLYKLDGIDHVLIDEAQDTSPDQWEILRALTAEFFVGKGAREAPRSVFAVGDPKQSIFSFQGADPAGFARSRDGFQQAVRQGGATFVSVPLHLSYRSTAPVLEAVDLVFAQDAARAGVDPDGEAIHHHVRRVGMAGLVELWPPVEPAKTDEPKPWEPPLVARDVGDPERKLADDIATRIRDWIDREDLPARGRKVRAGDVMVLVRRRTAFVEALIRRLKQLKIAVAGADRMVLTDQIAVQDVMSLIRFLLQPADDLSLAEALRSPLFDVDEATLEAVAADRGAMTLWRSLQARRSDHPATGSLDDLLAAADFVAPHEFLAEILVAGGGRRRMAARLGEQAGEPLDELLALALDFERDHAPSLQRFVAWIESGGAEVKRNLEQGRDEVRILTVHGAKGLQAPIVILPDTCQVPAAQDAILWRGGLPIWTVNKAYETSVVTTAKAERKERVMAEYRRLLYVAMTRAEDRLYVGGWTNGRARGEGNWHDLIAAALKKPISAPQEGPAVPETGAPAMIEAKAPEWAARPPPAEPTPPRPLAPSRFGDEPTARSPLDPADETRFRRGKLVHRLLQTLPDLAPEGRRAAGARFLASAARDLAQAVRDAILGETLAVLDRPEARALFAPGSRAEVAITGLVGDFVVSGQIDRLAMSGADEILVVDYKTNRDPPSNTGAAPPTYVAQLAAYRACLGKIYPGKSVRCFLLWTALPSLMEVPQAALDAHAPTA